MPELELYHNDMSSCSQKVRLTLEEKNLTWKGHHMNLRKGETRSKEYISKLNKNGVVPTFVYGNDIIIESTVIMEYLEDQFPENPLRPIKPEHKAKMRLWNKKLDEVLHSSVAIISSCVAFRYQFLEKYDKGEINNLIDKIPDEKRREISRDTIFNGLNSNFFEGAIFEFIKIFDELDKHLSNFKFLSGNNYTLADAAYTPYLTRFEHLQLSFLYQEKKYLSNWFSMIKEKENYRKAILNWNNDDYLNLMCLRGKESIKKIKKIISKT